MDPHDHASHAGQSHAAWLRYANQGATRNDPINPALASALSFLPEMGVTMEVFSGGQEAAGEGGSRTGSTRHDHGNAADVFFYKDGQRLDWSNPEHVPIFQEIVRNAKARGVTGIGAGDGYMQPGSMHVGFGPEAVWGAGGKGANAAPWLREAWGGATGVGPGNMPAPAPSYGPAPASGGNALAYQGLPQVSYGQNALATPPQQQRPQLQLTNYQMDPRDFQMPVNALSFIPVGG